MDLGENCFVVRFRKGLAETQRAEIVNLAAREEAMAEIGLAYRVNAGSTLFAQTAVILFQAAVLHCVEDGVEVRSLARLAAQIEVVSESSLGKVLDPVGRVIASINCPKISNTE